MRSMFEILKRNALKNNINFCNNQSVVNIFLLDAPKQTFFIDLQLQRSLIMIKVNYKNCTKKELQGEAYVQQWKHKD